MIRTACTLIVVTSLLGSAAVAQAPATLPSPDAAPARARHVAQLPPGFTRVELEGRTFFVAGGDEAWLAPAIRESVPATMPATMPTDLIANLNARREAITARMKADAGVDPARVDRYFDERLKVFLQQMEELRPPIIYLVTSPQQLKDAMRAGWTDPRYHYNRAADDVNFSTSVSLSTDELGDDMVLPLFFDPDQPPEQRQQRVVREMRATEASILNAISQRTQAMVLVAMVELISGEVLDPLDLKEDQEWFGVGVAGVLGGRYTAMLVGLDEQELVREMMRPDPRNPMRPSSLDLLHPTRLSDVRPEWLSAYTDAYRRRSMQVIGKLINEGGEGAIARVVDAMKQNPPADGRALAELIRRSTGVDLSAELAPA